jgi:hypothetical protein
MSPVCPQYCLSSCRFNVAYVRHWGAPQFAQAPRLPVSNAIPNPFRINTYRNVRKC